MKKNLMLSCLASAALLSGSAALAAVPAFDTLIAHRGESYDAPENTLPAYRTAVERGFGFECDVYLSKDGRVFTFHDGDLKRTSAGRLAKKCVEAEWTGEISTLDVGGWGKWKGSKFAGTRPALLEEVCALARDGRWIYCEVKGYDPTHVVPAIRRVLAAQSRATPKNFLFIAFGEAVCAALKREMPEYRVYWLHGLKQKGRGELKPEELIARAKACRADGVDIRYLDTVVTADYIAAIKAAGLSVHVWTVDKPAAAAEAFRRGAETVTTNRAKHILDTLSAQ